METTTKTKTKKKTIEAKTQDELNEIMAKQCTFSEAVKGVKDELKRIYPNEVFLTFSAEHGEQGRQGVVSVNHFGDTELTRQMLTLLMTQDKFVLDTIQKAWLGWIMLQDPKGKSNAFVKLYNAVLAYADTKGLDTSNVLHGDTSKKPEYEIGQDLKKADDLEAYLTILQKEQERGQSYMSPSTRITMLNAEIKRLRKAGDLDMVAKKTLELNAILDAEKARVEKEKRDAENRKRALENLAKGRAIRTANLERKRQADLDRERQKGRQQFQPGKAAKKKQQKIRERQAERNARKKKASESNDFHIVRNACSMGR